MPENVISTGTISEPGLLGHCSINQSIFISRMTNKLLPIKAISNNMMIFEHWKSSAANQLNGISKD